MKICTLCKNKLPLDDFYVDRSAKSGRRSRCKKCANNYWSTKPPEYRKELGKKKYQREKDLDPHHVKRTSVRIRHGMTLEEHEAWFIDRGSKCWICGSTENLHIDHDHSCCKSSRSCELCRRYPLCYVCNGALGMFKEDIELLLKAISYIKGDWKNE